MRESLAALYFYVVAIFSNKFVTSISSSPNSMFFKIMLQNWKKKSLKFLRSRISIKKVKKGVEGWKFSQKLISDPPLTIRDTRVGHFGPGSGVFLFLYF